uniref:C2H2-type domain-containing protein n=1 Tax=Seriola dumerili TaxID=41447 RepID=A0A3B4T4Y4_SERDU
MAVHRGEKRQSCRICNKRFVWHSGVECHKCVTGISQLHLTSSPAAGMRCNTGGKSSSFTECDKRLCYSHHLKKDMGAHTEENLFSCSVCGRKFTQRGYLIQHMARHTGKKSFICSECGKAFCGEENLKMHMRTHTGEKPFSCSFCDQGFTQKGYLTNHMEVHTEEKRFLYCVCGKRFAWRYNLKDHKCVGESSQPPQSQAKEEREAEPPASSSKTSDTSKLQADVSDDKGKPSTQKRLRVEVPFPPRQYERVVAELRHINI